MNDIEKFTLKVLRKLYAKTFHPQLPELKRETNPDRASDMIYNLLSSDKPCMIARFGAFELTTLLNYLSIKSSKHSVLKYIRGEEEQWWWNKKLMGFMCSNAGFFPSTEENLSRFCELMLKDIKQLDILESWKAEEVYLKDALNGCKLVTAEIAGPYFLNNPWTRVLKDKKVLVVHPFAKSIQKQFANRQFLFANPDVFPDFILLTIQAEQSLGGISDFKDWFAALNSMKLQISSTDFDICIIGCGAYGFPLAAHVKRLGKKAIHLAGMTQLLFGIWGSRWEKDNYSKYKYKALLNSYWIRPSKDETPNAANQVENKCYW